jgi:hypothetical protein
MWSLSVLPINIDTGLHFLKYLGLMPQCCIVDKNSIQGHVLIHTCNSSYSEGKNRKIAVHDQPGKS